MKFITIAFFLVIGYLATACSDTDYNNNEPNEMVTTPFGLMPATCVNEIPHESIIYEANGGSMVEHSDGTSTFIEERPECIEHFKKRNLSKLSSETLSSTTTETSFPKGWVLYTTYTLPTGDSSDPNFDLYGEYVVPDSPLVKNPVKNQIIYYFFSVENRGATYVAQPVLTYREPYGGWYIESWDCCIKNSANHSPRIPLNTNDIPSGNIYINKNNMIVIESSYGNQKVNFSRKYKNDFYWIQTVLEIYDVSSCDQLPPGDVTIKNITLTPNSGTANWETHNLLENTCSNAYIEAKNFDSVTINAGSNSSSK
jgi:hypothetical protein